MEILSLSTLIKTGVSNDLQQSHWSNSDETKQCISLSKVLTSIAMPHQCWFLYHDNTYQILKAIDYFNPKRLLAILKK